MRASELLYYMTHPDELRSIIQWKTWHQPVHERDISNEPPSLKICLAWLNKTSRSFSAVIQELHPELLVAVALFYLVLRGLDTIEDDMTLPLEKKEPLLRNFQNILEQDGWTFNENGPNEKDRGLLVEFNYVIEEFKKIKPAYKTIIKDITKEMGKGMADYANNAEYNKNGIETIEGYDRYCHYVAGLVGEGLTRLFVEAEMGNPALMQRENLYESMGLFLQKTNIIRDVREDWDDKRRFWPKEIWSKYVTDFDDLFKPENRDVALNCSSELVLNSLRHADECLFYLAGIKEQSVFNFCAIPQTMAIATLELVFRNPLIFEKNVKITKGQACELMIESTQNLKTVCDVFRKYARKIHAKNTPKDPNYLKISIQCGKIEQFIETIFPSQRPPTVKSTDELAREKRKAQDDAEAKKDAMFMGIAVTITLLLISALMIGLAWLMGARFDLAFDRAKHGQFAGPKTPEEAAAIASEYNQLAHEEL
ncbi:MAG: bifunctional farnesyl-diphosphate farnesyltransferase/squalene synthase [Cirrosporium novae-zelandiae]|nr:MAG: bifunctional farnesyl-diphosphate farnesyltransferase/squalene synthase [Cirrosporium novae-zelandiae]